MKFLSVCSGIEAASVAWRPLGWQAAAFAEIEKFPSAVLRHHYPDVENRGDMTRFPEWPDAAIDVLVGGTPCQSFSVAGLRKGLDDPRGSLLLVYLAIARRYRPDWLVWENVPGVLSIDDGRAFGSLLGGLALLGYGFAYRILDAQYFGLAQRRRRVFVVGHLGDWRRAAAVLFERASLSGHPAPRRETGEGLAGTLGVGSQSGGFRTTDLDNSGAFIPVTVGALGSGHSPNGHGYKGISVQEVAQGQCIAFGGNNTAGSIDVATAVRAKGGTGHGDFDSETFIAFSVKDHGADAGELAPTLRAGGHDRSHANGGAADGDQTNRSHASGGPVGSNISEELAYTLRNGRGQSVAFADVSNPVAANQGMQVRRLTPRECERLQGFPDDYTLIPYNGKPAKDGPRYKALGNSMAVPVMRWIGQRIAMVNQL
jgi:DNA (cytosine-5)-methyltransferase 1